MNVRHQIYWEPIDDYTKRLKVIGGWIVKHECVHRPGKYSNDSEMLGNMSMIFVPDPNHNWLIVKDEYKKWSVFDQPGVK